MSSLNRDNIPPTKSTSLATEVTLQRRGKSVVQHRVDVSWMDVVPSRIRLHKAENRKRLILDEANGDGLERLGNSIVECVCWVGDRDVGLSRVGIWLCVLLVVYGWLRG
jgi:hypothetical protein